jgi:carboxymethylenebutenolidase
MPRLDVTIKTRDGLCPASLFTPAEKAGPWPGVIFFMDGLGIRPSMWEMGQRLPVCSTERPALGCKTVS